MKTLFRLVQFSIIGLSTYLMLGHMYEYVVTDHGIEYFKNNPRDIIYILGTALLGGLVIVGFSCLSARWQRLIKIVLLVVAATLICFFAVLGLIVVCRIFHPAPLISISNWSFLLCFAVMMLISARLYYGVWKLLWKGSSHVNKAEPGAEADGVTAAT